MNDVRQHNPKSEKGKVTSEPITSPAPGNGGYPYSFTVNDSLVRLRFSGSGDLSTRLANAFTTMLQ